ncbi:MAG: mechanosensitive ion channel domain-containing protein [bacterium]
MNDFINIFSTTPSRLLLAIWLSLSIFFVILVLEKILIFLINNVFDIRYQKKIVKAQLPKEIFIYPLIVYLAGYLTLRLFIEIKYEKELNILALIVVIVCLLQYLYKLIEFVLEQELKRINNKDEIKVESTMYRLVFVTTKFITATVFFFIILKLFGFNISGILTGLGIGGIAIAFSLQNILTDLFASVTLYFDRPFRIGDYITIADEGGTVKQIGIKTTRLKTMLGDELVISNRELTTSKIHNFGKLKERRVEIKFAVEINTSQKKLITIKEIIPELLVKQELIKFDRFHLISVTGINYEFELVFHIESSSYPAYLDILDRFNFDLLKALEKIDVKLAGPRQTIVVER